MSLIRMELRGGDLGVNVSGLKGEDGVCWWDLYVCMCVFS